MSSRLPDHVRRLAFLGALCWAVYLLAMSVGPPTSAGALALLQVVFWGGVLLLAAALFGSVLHHRDIGSPVAEADPGRDNYRVD